MSQTANTETTIEEPVLYYSASTRGFYSSDYHENEIPQDCIVITKEEHKSYMEAQANGFMIGLPDATSNGKPVLIDLRPDPTVLKIQQARFLRDTILATTVDKITPLRMTTLTEAEKTAAVNYRQALLDVPQQTGFPDNIVWPECPEFLRAGSPNIS